MLAATCRIRMALAAAAVVAVASASAPAAVTLRGGEVVTGLEARPAEGPWRTLLSEAGEGGREWFWFCVAATGRHTAEAQDLQSASGLAAPPVCPPLDGDGQWLSCGAAVGEEAIEEVLRMTCTGLEDRRAEVFEAFAIERAAAPSGRTAAGLRIGRAERPGGLPLAPETATLSFMGGGLMAGLVVRRRRR